MEAEPTGPAGAPPTRKANWSSGSAQRWALAAISVGTAVLIVLLLLRMYIQNRAEILSAVDTTLSLQARLLAAGVEGEIEHHAATLRSIADALSKGNPPQRILALPAGKNNVRSITVLDLRGTVIESTESGQVGQSWARRPEFEQAVTQHEAVETVVVVPKRPLQLRADIGDAGLERAPNPADRRPLFLVWIAAPFRCPWYPPEIPGETESGLLLLEADLSPLLGQVLDRMPAGELPQPNAWVANGAGVILYSSAHPTWVGTSLYDESAECRQCHGPIPFLRQMRTRKLGVDSFDFPKTGLKRVAFVITKSPPREWVVLMTTTYQGATAFVRRDFRQTLLILGLMVVSIGCAAVGDHSTVKSRSLAQAETTRLKERQILEERARESEVKYRSLVELSPDGIAICEADEIVFANRAASRLLGCATTEEVVGRSPLEVVHPEYREEVTRIFAAMIQGQRLQLPMPSTLLRTDGSSIPVELAATPFVHGGRPAVLVVLRDLSARSHLEEQLRHAQRVEAVGRLAGGVAHDFNNLLQGLLSSVETLPARRSDSMTFDLAISEIRENVRRGAALARQLLLFARRDVSRKEPVDLNGLIQGTLELLRHLLRENVRFQIRMDEVPLPILSDRGQLEQVLVNLVLNASDAMPAGGELTLRTGILDGTGEVWFEVEDTGIGMTDSLIARIFEPFFTTKDSGKGTGLGLAVVHGIITGQGGRIEVKSRVGEGSTFRVTLPRSGSDAAAEPIAKMADLAPRGHGERVLVVEDEDNTREALVDLLSLLGYQVSSVGSSEDARSLDSTPPFDLLLTDFMLPGASGADLARNLGTRWPNLKVILMSGYTEDEAVREEVARGGITFLQKPFEMNTLAMAIRRRLDVEKS